MATNFDWSGLDKTLGVPPPSVGDPLQDYISQLEERFSLPKGIMSAIRKIETGGVAGDPNLAVSSAGATGMFQLKPETAAEYDPNANLADPRTNALIAAQHLQSLGNLPGVEDPTFGAIRRALAYQMGRGHYQRYGVGNMTDFSKIPMREARGYADKFTSLYHPPATVSSVGQGTPPAPSALVAPPALSTVTTSPPTGMPPQPAYQGLDQALAQEPTLLESLANKAGAVGDFFGRIGETAPLRAFSGVMGAQKKYLTEPLLGATLGYDPSKETFESYTGGLLGGLAQAEGVPGATSPIVGGAASGVWQALAGMATDPIVYELAALGTVLGPEGTVAGGAIGGVVSAIRRFLGANQGLHKALSVSNKLTGLGFQGQMALGAATKLPTAISQISLNPQNPEGYSNLAGGLIDSYFTYHSLVPRALRKGVSEYDIPGIGKVNLAGPQGQPIPYELAHQVLSEPMALAQIRYGHELLSSEWADGLAVGDYVGDMPPLVVGIGSGARGEVIPDANGNVRGVMLDPMNIVSELVATPPEFRGEAFHMRMAGWVEHELGLHVWQNFAIPHSLPPETRTQLQEFKLRYDERVDALQREADAMKEQEEGGRMAPNPLRWEQLKTEQSAALADYLSQRIGILDAVAKATGRTVEELVGPEARAEELLSFKQGRMREAIARTRQEWETKWPGGLNEMLSDLMDKSGTLEKTWGVPLQSPEAAEFGRQLRTGGVQPRPLLPGDIRVGYGLGRTLEPAETLAKRAGLPEPPIDIIRARRRKVSGQPTPEGRPFFSEGPPLRPDDAALRQLTEESDTARQLLEEAKTPEERAYAAQELERIQGALKTLTPLPAEPGEPSPPMRPEPYRFSVTGRTPEQIRQGYVPPEIDPREVAKLVMQDPRLMAMGFRVRRGTGKEPYQLRYKERLVEPLGVGKKPLDRGRIEGLQKAMNRIAQEEGLPLEALKSTGPLTREGATMITTPEKPEEAADVVPIYSMLQAHARRFAEERTGKLEKAVKAAEARAAALESRLATGQGVVERGGEKYFQEAPTPTPVAAPEGGLERRVWEATQKAMAPPPPAREEKFRASVDIPLNAEGKAEAEAQAKQLASLGGFDEIYHDNQKRTKETAGAFKRAMPKAVLRTTGVRSQSQALGQFEGQPVTPETLAAMQDMVENPDKRPGPGGPESTRKPETFNEFLQRYLPLVDELHAKAQKEGKAIALITHNRNIITEDARLAKQGEEGRGRSVDPEVMRGKGPETGSVNKVIDHATEDWTGKPIDPGLYLIRHAQTDWNPPKEKPVEAKAVNIGQILSGFPKEERASAAKLAQTYLRQLGTKPTGPPTEVRAEKAVGAARMEAETTRQRLAAGITPEEWRGALEKVPAKKEEFTYPALFDWLNEQKAAGRTSIPVEDVLSHLRTYSPIVAPESKHAMWQERVPVPPEIREKQAALEGVETELENVRQKIVEAREPAVRAPFDQAVGGDFFADFERRKGAPLSAASRADIISSMEEAIKSAARDKWVKGVIQERFNKYLGFLRGENPLTFYEAQALGTKGFGFMDSTLRDAANYKDWRDSYYRLPAETRNAIQIEMSPEKKAEHLAGWENMSADDKRYYTKFLIPDHAIENIVYNVNEMISNGDADWYKFFSGDLPANRIPPGWENYAQWEKADYINNLPKAERPNWIYAKKIYDAVPASETSAVTIPALEGLREQERNLDRQRQNLSYDIQNARDRLGRGRSVSYETYNRTPGDTEYKEVAGVPGGPPFVPARTMQELGVTETTKGGPEVGTEPFVELARPTVGPRKKTTALGPLAELPSERLTGMAMAPAGTRGLEPGALETDVQKERERMLGQFGSRQIPHVNPFGQHGFKGSFHNRFEAWKLDPNSPQEDTLATMETQSDVHQKVEKFGGWTPGWEARARVLKQAASKMLRGGGEVALPNLRAENFHDALRAGNYENFFKIHPLVKEGLQDYIKELNKGEEKETLYGWLGKARKQLKELEKIEDFWNRPSAMVDNFREWLTYDWQRPSKMQPEIHRRAAQVNAASQLIKGFPADYPWAQHWVEQSAKTAIGEGLLRGFNNIALNHPSYAKATAGDSTLLWEYTAPKEGQPAKLAFGVSGVRYEEPKLGPEGGITQETKWGYGGRPRVRGLDESREIKRKGNIWWSPEIGNVDWNLDNAEKFLAAAPKIDVFTKSGELTPAAKEAMKGIHPKWDLDKFMGSKLFETFAEGQPQQDYLTGQFHPIDRLGSVVRQMRNVLAEATNPPEGYTGGDTAARAEAFDRFIGGKVKNTYSKIMASLGYNSADAAEKIIAANPNVKILETPKEPGDPVLVAVPVTHGPGGGELRAGLHRFVYMWPDIQGLKNKLPVVEGGRPREEGDTSPGVGFFASKGSLLRPGRELYGFDPLIHESFQSKPLKGAEEGSYWAFSRVDHPVWEAINAPRALITSLDLSGVLRQGLIATARETLTNPARLIDNFRNSLKTLGDEDFYRRSMSALENAPSMEELRRFGMDFAQKEEAYAGTRVLTSLAKKFGLPDFPRASERAYTYFLNRIRYEQARDKFNRLKEMGFTPEKDRWLFESAAKWANIITGRGNLPTGKDPLSQAVRSAEGLMNTLMFSPRLMLSRLAVLNPYVYGRTAIAAGKSKGATGAVGAFWAVHGLDIAAMAAMGGALTAGIKAAFGGDIEDDPRSSDFAQARIGNTRVDLTGGLRTYLTTAARLVTGESKSTIGGSIREVGALETVGRFLRGKLSPVPGTIADVISGKRVTGEETMGPLKDIISGKQPLDKATAMEFARTVVEGPLASLTIPMILRDLKNLYDEDPSLAVGLAAPLVLGAGVTVHEMRGGLTPGLVQTFKRTEIEPMAPLTGVSTGVKDLSGKTISLDIPYMLRKQLETEVDQPLYAKLEQMTSTPRFLALTPVQQRVAILAALTPLYKMRRAQALRALGPAEFQKGVREKMIPEAWKRLGVPPGLPEVPEPSPSLFF